MTITLASFKVGYACFKELLRRDMVSPNHHAGEVGLIRKLKDIHPSFLGSSHSYRSKTPNVYISSYRTVNDVLNGAREHEVRHILMEKQEHITELELLLGIQGSSY